MPRDLVWGSVCERVAPELSSKMDAIHVHMTTWCECECVCERAAPELSCEMDAIHVHMTTWCVDGCGRKARGTGGGVLLLCVRAGV